MGDALGIQSPFPYIRMEPSFIAVPVEACTFHSTPEFIRKQMRYHMPRTSERLRKDYDVLILSDANRHVFRPQAIDWMSEAVKEDGLGIIMIGGAESFEGRGGIMPSWATTTVADVLPVNMLEREYCAGDAYGNRRSGRRAGKVASLEHAGIEGSLQRGTQDDVEAERPPYSRGDNL